MLHDGCQSLSETSSRVPTRTMSHLHDFGTKNETPRAKLGRSFVRVFLLAAID
jgi:hypothetical protein